MIQISKPAAPWICLAGTLALFLLCVAWLHPASWFGMYRDDALYFSSAKALAEGRGYILPSLPGNPPQTKYPVFYPWLLSRVWKWNPSFPANLGQSICLTALFSCGFLVVTFQMLRKLKGVGDWPAMTMVAVCASLPAFLLVSGSVLSDPLFMVLALAAAVLADRAVRANGHLPLAALVGVLAGLSLITRSVGVAVVVGIVLAGLFRRALRQAAAVCLGAAPFALIALWVGRLSLARSGAGLHNYAPGMPLGWQQTFAYYTSYPQMWKFCVPNVYVFLSMLRGNLGAFLETPAWYWLHPTLKIGTSFTATALSSPLMLIALAGILRQARRDEWRPLHFVFAPYLAILLLWNYPVMDRFLLLFLPLFCLGLWVEGNHLAGLLWGALKAGGLGERVLAGVVSAGLAILVAIGVWNTFQFYRPNPAAEQQAARLKQDKAQAYDWIRENALPDDRIVACEDGRVYLYTGHQTVMPIAFSSEYHYTHDSRVLERDLAHMADAAAVVQAHYWLTSLDDFITDEEGAQPAMRAREAQLMAGLPEVYRSPDGWVQLYDISCSLQPQRAPCSSGVPFAPAGIEGTKSEPGMH